MDTRVVIQQHQLTSKVFVCERKRDSKLCAVKVVKITSEVIPFEAKVLQKLNHVCSETVYLRHKFKY